jgi:hypothetical protein
MAVSRLVAAGAEERKHLVAEAGAKRSWVEQEQYGECAFHRPPRLCSAHQDLG